MVKKYSGMQYNLDWDITYIGKFKGNRFNGKGLYISHDGVRYSGIFKSFLLEDGTIYYNHIDKYIGEIKLNYHKENNYDINFLKNCR